MVAFFLSKYTLTNIPPLSVHQSDNRHLRWCEKPERRTPRPAPPAHIEEGMMGELKESRIVGVKDLHDIIEGKELPFVRMP